MANIGYALDILGTNPNNKVSETRTLTKKAIDGRAFVIPKAAPFFAEGVVVVIRLGSCTAADSHLLAALLRGADHICDDEDLEGRVDEKSTSSGETNFP
jgi:hypothetical protein